MISTEVYVALSNLHPQEAIDLAKAAERLGVQGVTVPDHLCLPLAPGSYPYNSDGRPPFDPAASWPDVWVLIGAMAAVTTKLRFRTSVYVLPLRHPIVAARAIGTAAAIAPGRIDVGIGVGWLEPEFDAMAVDFHRRGALADEAIEAVRVLLRSGPVEHTGDRWRFGPVFMHPAPSKPVPLLIGGASERALRRAVRLGDGYVAPAMSLSETRRVRAELQRLCRDHERDWTAFEFHARLDGYPSDEDLAAFDDLGVDSVQVALWDVSDAMETRLERLSAFASATGLVPRN